MNTETIEYDETPVKRADALEVGDHVIDEPEYGKPPRPMRVVLAHPFANGDGRRMVSLVLDALDGKEPKNVRARAEVMYEMADERDLAEMRGAGKRHALAQALRQLADDIVEHRLAIPAYRLHVTGCLDSRAEVERWAKHLGVEVRLGGTKANIPLANKELDVHDSLLLDVQFQSDPEPEKSAEPDETPQDWFFTFGAGQTYDGRFVRINGTYDSARSRMNLAFGHAWCAQYDWQRFDEEGLPSRLLALPESEWPAHVPTRDGE